MEVCVWPGEPGATRQGLSSALKYDPIGIPQPLVSVDHVCLRLHYSELWYPFPTESADPSRGDGQCFQLTDLQVQHLTEKKESLEDFPPNDCCVRAG